MADEIGKLLKNEDSSSQIKPAASQKKLRESKKRLNHRRVHSPMLAS